MRQAIRTIVSVAACLAAMTPAPAALRVLATTPDWAALTTELGDRFTVVKVRDELAPEGLPQPRLALGAGAYRGRKREYRSGLWSPNSSTAFRLTPVSRRASSTART